MKYIERDLEKEVLRYLNRKEILAIVGTRQCGKTTMINYILDSIKNKKINKLTFENVKHLQLFEEDIDSFIELNIKNFDIVFIDEIHYAKESGKKLKYIYDTQNIKIIISGSSATEISIQSLKYLVGRILTFTLYPFSFREYLKHKNQRFVSLFDTGNYKDPITKEMNKYLEEFVLYGGYPAVVKSETKEEKKKVLESIYNIYLLKEIREILSLSEDHKLITLLKTLSLQIGNIISYSELSTITGFSFIELKKYLNILEKTYICSLIKPFFTNKRSELVHNPKIYFIDAGFRNISIDNFNSERADKGAIYEQFICAEIIKTGKTPRFWNTKAKAEVDFILEQEGETIPIEIKSTVKDEKVTRSFRSFIEKYNPKKGFMLSNDFEGEINMRSCKVLFLPFVKFVGKR